MKEQLCGEQVPSEKPWHSHSTAICTDWIAEHNRIATHYCRTHRFDAPIPKHKVSQDMQSTVAQHHQKREKITCNPQLYCARISGRIRGQSDNARNCRAREPTFLRNGTSVYPKNHNHYHLRFPSSTRPSRKALVKPGPRPSFTLKVKLGPATWGQVWPCPDQTSHGWSTIINIRMNTACCSMLKKPDCIGIMG